MGQSDQWLLAGNVPENYERYLVPAIFASYAENLVQHGAARSGDNVLDIACGTGIAARTATPLVGYTGKVVGLDLAPGMLKIARSAPLPSKARVEVDWQEGDVIKMPFDDGSFDVAICQQGLQFFPDPSAALKEVHRVLRPGGRIAFSVWRPIQFSSGYLVLAEALGRHISEEAGNTMRLPFSFTPQRIRSLFTESGFNDIRVRIEVLPARFPSCEEFVKRQVASSPLAGPVGQASEQARIALTNEVSAALDACVDDDGLVFPLETHIVVAHR